MTNIQIQALVKCPALYDHDPCDLIPASDCLTCKYFNWVVGNAIICNWGEP